MEAPYASSTERLLTFEVAGKAYGIPIADVAEVAELGPVVSVPTLPRRAGGVMNHHGDALPVVHREVLFDVNEEALSEPEHVLVLARTKHVKGRLGLPVDRVLGLVEGRGGVAAGEDAVVERRPIDGQIVRVLDTQRLTELAVGVIERSVIGAGYAEGVET